MSKNRTPSPISQRNSLWQHISYRVSAVHLLVFMITALAVFLRFYNYDQFLYFIYDQGRDAWKLHEMAGGDLTLIGPTSGLPGFFLGPLWYYAGLPGYLLSQGSPYGISLWYIFLATLALPFFWLIARALFPQQTRWQVAAYAILCFVPGSISGSTFIWNPLISIPLMAVTLWSLFRARESRLFLMLAFMSLGLVLHSEFAYGVFLIPVLYLLIFWIRGRFSVIDYVLAAAALGLTFLPQVAFELKNNFIMTRALWEGTASSDTSVPLLQIWIERPMQLLHATRQLLVGNMQGSRVLVWGVVALLLGGLLWLVRMGKRELPPKIRFNWYITALIAVTPYVGYMFWTGNYGNFFSYYVTPHFIFLALVLLLGIHRWAEIPLITRFATQLGTQTHQAVQVAAIFILLSVSWLTAADVVVFPRNDAGMHVVNTAVWQVLEWQAADRRQVAEFSDQDYSSSTTTFTPNFLTAQYDYFLHWRSNLAHKEVPYTQARAEDSIVYAIIEPDKEIPEKRFAPWYSKVSAGRVLIRRQRVGVLVLETWAEPEFALLHELPEPYQPSIIEQMGWE